MKKKKTCIWFLLFSVCVVFLSACGKETASPTEKKGPLVITLRLS